MKKTIAVFCAAAFPGLALAEEMLMPSSAKHVELVSLNAENIILFANLVLGALAAMYAVKLAAVSTGGAFEKTWNGIAIAAILFVFLEASNLIAGLGIVHFQGVSDILETLYIVVLLAVFIRTRRNLLGAVGK